MITLETLHHISLPRGGGQRAIKSYWRRRFFRILRQKKRDEADWLVLCYQLLFNDSCATVAAASSNAAIALGLKPDPAPPSIQARSQS